MADEWYEFATKEHFWMRWRFNVLKKLLPKGYSWGETLDIGAGNGLARQQIEEYYSCSVSVCDLNMYALERLPQGRGEVYFYNIQQRNKEFCGRFQTILLLDVLEHIKDPIAFLEAVYFHLKPGGKVIINLPACQFFYCGYDRVAGHVKRYAVSKIKDELQQSGFKVEDVVYWGGVLVPLLLMRKMYMPFCKDTHAIKYGFQSSSTLINSLFLLLMKIELKINPRPFIGTSLLVLASKEA
jgi:SAM-dependent methyltransferase